LVSLGKQVKNNLLKTNKMEILKDKKIIIGALSVIGVIALISYFRKPKRNSEGFFNMSGDSLPKTSLFLPTSFLRKDPFCKLCVRYEKTMTPKGFIYTKRLTSGNTVSLEVVSITEQEYVSAFTKNNFCEAIPPKQIIK
jgi:hypothetical protein